MDEDVNHSDYFHDEEKYINETVKTILMLDHSKKPFKQNDILKCLSKKPSRKQWINVINKSKRRLNDMGLKLIKTKHTNAHFILVSNNYPVSSMYRLASESELADRTLLILVLTYIFMKEGAVSNVDVFNHLQHLDIYDEKIPVHPYFGDVKKKILNDFVSQLYLEKVVDKESETFEILWGERALAEVSKRSILEFVCKIGYDGEIQPKNLASHYKIALEEEKNAKTDQNLDDDVMAVDD